MQTLTDDEWRILASKLQIGSDAHHAIVELPDVFVAGPINTSSDLTTSNIYGITPTATFDQTHTGSPVVLTDGLGTSAVFFAGELLLGATIYNIAEFAIVVGTVIGTVSIIAAYDGLPDPGYTSFEVLVDGSPVAGAWTANDADGWDLPLGGYFFTWRPTGAYPVATASLTIKETVGPATFAGGWTWKQALVRGSTPGTPLQLTGVSRIGMDKSRQTDADACTIEIQIP